MSLFLIRHGQSVANRATHADERNLVDTGDDSNLTRLGELQSKRVGQTLARLTKNHYDVPTIHCSPLVRAEQTAHVIHQYLPHARVETHTALREIEVRDGDVSAAVKSARADLNGIVSHIKQNYQEPLVCIAHEWVMQVLMQSLLGCPKCDIWFRFANCSLTEFVVDRCIRSDGRFHDGLSLSSLNDVTHLDSDQITY